MNLIAVPRYGPVIVLECGHITEGVGQLAGVVHLISAGAHCVVYCRSCHDYQATAMIVRYS